MISPFFSIVIPTYNRAAFIGKTIQTVLQQDYQDFEIIVVDDGSTDNTESVVKSIGDPRIRYIRKANEERAVARNTGAALSKGDYVNFLDSDDVLYPTHLSVAKDFINTMGKPEVFHLAYDIKRPDGAILKISDAIAGINLYILSGNMLSCNGVFIRRDIIMHNRFHENRILSGLEDWELWIRLAARYTIHSVRTVTSTVIQHDERSVVSGDSERIKKKVECFVQQVEADKKNQEVYGKNLLRTRASAYTYAALHIAMLRSSNKSEIFRYLIRGVRSNPLEILKKRFLVIIKLALLK